LECLTWSHCARSRCDVPRPQAKPAGKCSGGVFGYNAFPARQQEIVEAT